MNKKQSKNHEYENFSDLATEWWDQNGKFKLLHRILPLRIEYILKNINKKEINKQNILDLGCGGGLTCEPLAKLGATVTGVDFIKKNIEIAKKHSAYSNLKIKYINDDLNKIIFKEKYDLILLLEVIEHLDNWESLIKKISKIIKPNGKLIISTINKTYLSKIFAIEIAENLLNWVPKNTHNYDKLIDPQVLKKTLIKNNLSFLNIVGMNYNPIFREWRLNKKYYPMNYFCTAQKN